MGRERVPMSSKTLSWEKRCTCCATEHPRMADSALSVCSSFIVTDSCFPTTVCQLPRVVWWPDLKQKRFTLFSRDSSLYFSSPSLTPGLFNLPGARMHNIQLRLSLWPLTADRGRPPPPPLDPTHYRTGGGTLPYF